MAVIGVEDPGWFGVSLKVFCLRNRVVKKVDSASEEVSVKMHLDAHLDFFTPFLGRDLLMGMTE